jgi:hypothetical protein
MRHPFWREDGPVIYSYNCFWTLPEQSLSGPRPAELTTIFYCLIWDFPHLRARAPYLYPPGTGWRSYLPGTGFPFRRLLRYAGQRWRYSNPPSHGCRIWTSSGKNLSHTFFGYVTDQIENEVSNRQDAKTLQLSSYIVACIRQAHKTARRSHKPTFLA